MSELRSIRERFPAPWRVDALPAGFRVVDCNGTPLTYVYASTNEDRGLVSSRGLTPAEARTIAEAIAALPSRA